MKRFILLLTALLLIASPLCASADGSSPDGIIAVLQPCSPNYPEYSVAMYVFEVSGGESLTARWYLDYEGKTYLISGNSGEQMPWEAYAGERYGAGSDGNRFWFFFEGVESGLNGAEIYCHVTDGVGVCASAKAVVSVSGTATPPSIIKAPAYIDAQVGSEAEIRCIAASNDESELIFNWYETSSGRLQDIIAIQDASVYSDTYEPDTSKPGRRYYVCGVETSNGGMAYTHPIPVVVNEFAVPVIYDDAVPEGAVGEKYEYKLSANGKDTRFEIANAEGDGSIGNSGLKLGSDGVISGTPEKEGDYVFRVRTTNGGREEFRTFTLRVIDPKEPDEGSDPGEGSQDESGADSETAPADESVKTPDESEKTPEGGTSVDNENKGGVDSWVIVLIICVTVIILAAMTFIFLSKRKKG